MAANKRSLAVIRNPAIYMTQCLPNVVRQENKLLSRWIQADPAWKGGERNTAVGSSDL